MPRADGAFALVDMREIEVEASATRFHEDERVPSDADVVGNTWARANKDGSPDRRFASNHQIPICLYGRITFRCLGGLTEEYIFSNVRAAEAFAMAFLAYQKALKEDRARAS